MRLYFVRHGESEANRLHEISNRGRRHPLTERGQQQAAALAQALREQAIAALYTSPLLRAVQTAEAIAQACGQPYTETDALREYDCGTLEGRSDDATWEAYSQMVDEWIARGHWDSRPAGGESFRDMQARFVPLVTGLAETYAAVPAAVVLVGHGGLYRLMLPQVLCNLDHVYTLTNAIPPTGVVVAEPRREGLVCVSWCGAPIRS